MIPIIQIIRSWVLSWLKKVLYANLMNLNHRNHGHFWTIWKNFEIKKRTRKLFTDLITKIDNKTFDNQFSTDTNE